MKRVMGGLLGCALVASGALRVMVTVVEQKTGRPVEGLKAEDFSFIEEKTVRRVDAAEFGRKPVDVMLLVDTSLMGEMVQPVAGSLIAELREKEQMAVVAFDTSTDLVQDFTSSKQMLSAALGKVKYGNSPRVLDALFAAMDGGFRNAALRRVILLVTAGVEGRSRVTDKEVVRLARKLGVSIYPVYAARPGRGLFENLARQTGGASFLLKDLQKTGSGGSTAAARIFDVVRGYYTLTLPGNLGLSEKLKVEVQGMEKVNVSVMSLE